MLTRRDLASGLAAGTAGVALAKVSPALAAPGPDRYRPQVHYSPPAGFMNDPNGLVFVDGEYHLFYQHNPFEPKAGRVHWGHAVSRDLLHWQTLPIALPETAAGQAFSGSAVVDAENRSGLFDSAPGGIVAAYTRAAETLQTQEIAFSSDRGRTFRPYPGNPVIDRNSPSFRDPKVFFHAPSGRWVMAVVLSREHRVAFYGSPDLKRWGELGSFGPAGLLGVDYECPDLVEVPVEAGSGSKWVLFVSINPGAPQGGSAVQYFVGEFDGARFTPDDAAVRLMDFGKDFYALQTWSNLPEGPPLAIAWMSNWQYCDFVPTATWRGVMSLPRRLTLRRTGADWRLVQVPVALEPIHDQALLFLADAAVPDAGIRTAVPPGAALEIRARLRQEENAAAVLRLDNPGGEYLDIGYDARAAQFFIDRGGGRGFENRFFTDKFAAAAPPKTRDVDLHLIVDRCTLELFAGGGEIAGSVLHFLAEPADRLTLTATDGQVTAASLQVRTLNSTLGPT